MSGDDPADLAFKPLGSKYLNGLLGNVTATQDHLAGNDGTPLSPSFLPPNTIWTPEEKNAFFHALSVYSRFRPDLISYEIKTKSISEVCNYLSVLQLAASQQETAVPYSQWRQNLPVAMEVSPEWIAMEEEAARDVIAREQDWQRDLIAEQRCVELRSLEKRYKTEPHDLRLSRRKAELKLEIAKANLHDKQKDFCSSLGSLELTAIGAVLREATDSSGSSWVKPPSAPHTPAPQDSPEPAVGLRASQPLPFSATNAADTLKPLNPTSRRSTREGGPSPPNPTELPQPSSPNRDLTALSPVSRRRHQKRLYMRRKRASMSGVTSIDDSVERLKPGRKKAERSPSPEGESRDNPQLPTSVVRDMGATSVPGTDGSSVTQKRYPRAKQMSIDKLRNLSLNANDLKGLGFDVVNPEGVAKMLDLWDKLSGDTSGHGSRISADTIQLLDAHVVWFVKNLIYRAITLREQERALKSETKVWKLPGKPALAREHVERAVSMTNSRELNKAAFFEDLVAEMNVTTGAEETEAESTKGCPDATLSPLHRDIYAPLVWISEPEDDSEMSDDTDDEAVDDELLEEAQLDELDMDIEMEHESGLWGRAQRSQVSGPKTEVPITKGGRRKAYNSMELIEDSD